MEIQRYWFGSVIAIGIFISIYLIFRLLVRIGYLVLYRKYAIKLKIARISFFSFQGIYLHLRNGTTLEIEKIWISSSLCHVNLKSLIAICINDIRLQGDSEWITSSSNKKNSSPGSGKSIGIRTSTWLLSKLLSSKLFSIHTFNASIMQLGKPEEEFLLHVSTKELVMYCTSNSKQMEINTAITSAFVKVYKHSPLNSEQTRTESCLLNVSAIITVKIQVSSNQKFRIQSFFLRVTQPELILHEGFSISKLKRQVSDGLSKNKVKQINNSESVSTGATEIVDSYQDTRKLQHIFSKFPSEMYLLIDSFSIKLMKEGGHRAFTLDVKSVETEFKRNDPLENLDILSIHYSFCILDVRAATGHLPFAELLKAEVQFDVHKKIINSKLNMSSLAFSYDRETLQYWLRAMPSSSSKDMKAKKKKKIKSNSYQNLVEVFKEFQFRNTTQCDDVCISATLPGCNAFSVGLTHFRFSVRDHSLAVDGSDEVFQSFVERNFSLEILLEAAYFKIGDETLPDSFSHKRHFWNTPFSVGMILFKKFVHYDCEFIINQNTILSQKPIFLMGGYSVDIESKKHKSHIFKRTKGNFSAVKAKFYREDITTECMMDTLQLEWSPSLAELVKDVKNCVKESSSTVLEEMPMGSTLIDNQESPPQSSFIKELLMNKKCSMQLNLCSVNMFFISEVKIVIVMRFDYINVEYRGDRIKSSFEECKLSSMNLTMPNYSCIKCLEMKPFLCHIAQSSITYDMSKQEISLEMSRDVFTMWNTTLHMSCLSVIEDIKALKTVLVANQKNPSVSKPKDNQHKSFCLKLHGNIHIGLTLSSSHQIVFFSPEVNAKFSQHLKMAQTGLLSVIFDDHEIFKFKQFQIHLAPGTEQNVYNRKSFDDLELSNNRLLCFMIDEFNLTFPYQYDFAEAFTEEFNGVIKWFKKVHKKKKVPFTLESQLPPDLSIITKVWTIEIQDDPFEVKLRDNFELLEDEYHESLKRKKMLDEEIESFQRKRLIPGEKINELYFKLSKKNSEIYILRSKQLYQCSPMRKSLITWQLDDIEISAVADTSYHGTERVIQCMKKINGESPFPEEGLEFNTLWARKVRCSTSTWSCTLRDFQQPLLMIKGLHVWGFLLGAEQEGPPRAKRSSTIEIGEPWSNDSVERNMPALKFYHDLTFDIEEMCMSYGPCWEPPMAQVSLSMEYISHPSLDPSPTLPWWDKMRLLYHGRLTFSIQHLALLMRASLDPYNNTELMELTWTDVIIDWTTGKIITKGDLDMYVHTASKYDDCHVLHIPSLKLSISMDWLCLGNPYDHHSVVPCAPDKIPEYSINQEHDSYRAFRSQNLNISYSYESKYVNTETADHPAMLLYSSTLKWIENLKMILSGVTRLTRRGKLFSNVKPRKPQLSRHYRNVRVSLNLPKFQICYWMSFAKRQGLELIGGRLALSSENTLSLVPVNDNLKHRSRASWNIGYLNCELCDSEIWLYDWMPVDANESTADSFHNPVEKSYFLSVNRVSYGREEIVKNVVSDVDKPDTPTHRLVVYGLKGAWTKHNRNVVFGLYDSYTKNVLLKKNLSTEALRGFKVETQNTPQKLRSQTSASQNAAQSPITHLQSGHAVSMLQKLIAEAEANPMVFTEELEGSTREQVLHGVSACQTDDVLQKKWLVELVNSQVMLRGCETSGYVIVSAAKAQILQRIHVPVWKDRSLVSKTTWVGSFECMQYYATVDAGTSGNLSMDNVIWLSVDHIDGRDLAMICDLPDLVGSGRSVGGVVSNTVGAASDPESAPIQLQRIVSRCCCQFFCASYGENVDPSCLDEVPPLPDNIDIWEPEVAVDSFTLNHHDLEICTNSLQYAMILDLVNNLLLYVEPRKKEAIEKLQYMRFQLQLRSVDDQKEPILQLQEKVRSLVSKLRRLEKDAYNTHRLYLENQESGEYLERLQQFENSIYSCKEKLNTMNEELTTMICCFKETQIIACKTRQRSTSQDKGICIARRAEVCFKHAKWRLTDADGQLGIADLVLSNFLYSKVTKSDESVEHLLEIGYVEVINLLPNQLYKNVLHPTEVQTSIPLDRQCMLRIYCRERAPVGGISVKEHLELNVIPLAIGLTDAFYKAMLKFFFPGRDTDKDDHREEEHETASHKKRDMMQKRSSTFYSDREDIEKMKERADKNHTFFYIKIPEVPLRVSYKGKKEKNIEDVENLNLVLTTLEYHNKTWTWLDLLMELKNDAKKILLSQAIREKIRVIKRKGSPERDVEPQEEEKASMLFGPKLLAGPERSSKRKIFGRPK